MQVQRESGSAEEHSLDKEARKWASRVAREYKSIIHTQRVRTGRFQPCARSHKASGLAAGCKQPANSAVFLGFFVAAPLESGMTNKESWNRKLIWQWVQCGNFETEASKHPHLHVYTCRIHQAQLFVFLRNGQSAPCLCHLSSIFYCMCTLWHSCLSRISASHKCTLTILICLLETSVFNERWLKA